MRSLFALLAPLCLIAAFAAPAGAQNQPALLVSGPDSAAGTAHDRVSFDVIARRMARAAQKLCRAQNPGFGMDCTFTILRVKDARLGSNAFHTLDKSGGPVIVVSEALLALTRSPDEIAFVIGHEAAHYISKHDQRLKAATKARMGAIMTAAAAQGSANSAPAQSASAMLRAFEFEADSLGASLVTAAGFDARNGASLLARPEFKGAETAAANHPSGKARLQALLVSENS